jgi:hypothetical protein
MILAIEGFCKCGLGKGKQRRDGDEDTDANGWDSEFHVFLAPK